MLFQSLKNQALLLKLDAEIGRLTREMDQCVQAFGVEFYDLCVVVDKTTTQVITIEKLPSSFSTFESEILAKLQECHEVVTKLLHEKNILEQTFPGLEARKLRSDAINPPAITISSQFVRATDWVVETSEKVSAMQKLKVLDKCIQERKALFGSEMWPLCAEIEVPEIKGSDKLLGGLASATAALGSSTSYQAVTKASSGVASRVATRSHGIVAGLGVRHALTKASANMTESTSQYIRSFSTRDARIHTCIATVQQDMELLGQWRQRKYDEKESLLAPKTPRNTVAATSS